MVNVQRQGDFQLNINSQLQVIFPMNNFSCNGRITGYMASLYQENNGNDYPSIQVWHRNQSMFYTKINEYTLMENDITEMRNYYFANVSFTANETIEFQAGDILGYYHPFSPRYTIWVINNPGFISHGIRENSSRFNITSSTLTSNQRQPLIQLLFGMIIFI